MAIYPVNRDPFGNVLNTLKQGYDVDSSVEKLAFSEQALRQINQHLERIGYQRIKLLTNSNNVTATIHNGGWITLIGLIGTTVLAARKPFLYSLAPLCTVITTNLVQVYLINRVFGSPGTIEWKLRKTAMETGMLDIYERFANKLSRSSDPINELPPSSNVIDLERGDFDGGFEALINTAMSTENSRKRNSFYINAHQHVLSNRRHLPNRKLLKKVQILLNAPAHLAISDSYHRACKKAYSVANLQLNVLSTIAYPITLLLIGVTLFDEKTTLNILFIGLCTVSAISILFHVQDEFKKHRVALEPLEDKAAALGRINGFGKVLSRLTYNA